jgi:ribonuclease HII
MIVVGIDEAGRGPLAGPVAVGAVRALVRRPTVLEGIRDSKTLSAKAREEWFLRIAHAPDLAFAVALVGSQVIDTEGIVSAVRMGIARVLRRLSVEPDALILLDGGLRPPKQFVTYETIIRGDASESLIAAGAIMAKVLRDRKMCAYASMYPAYGFEIHKGYGTRVHQQAISMHGLSPVHRHTFIHTVG